MTKEEAIKYLQQLYPNGGHCLLDEQRIEAINMAVNALQEKPKDKCQGCNNVKACITCVDGSERAHIEECVSIDFEQELYKAFGQVKDFTLGMQIAKRFYDMGKNSKVPANDELEEAGKEWLRPQLEKYYEPYGEGKMMELTKFDGYAMLDAIEFGAQWQKEQEYTCYEEAFEDGAKWKKEQIEEALLSEVLPCFMHGGEADDVVAKLDEVLNQKK